MNLIKKLSTIFIALTTLCGCWPQEDPGKIYRIVLVSGNLQKVLKIPSSYIQEKNEKLRAKEGVRAGFLYPSLAPFVNETPTDNSVSVYIRLISDPNRISMSDSFLNTIKARMKIPFDKNPARYLGKSGAYDVYEDTDLQTHSITTTEFTIDKAGNLLKFDSVPGLRSQAWRRYGGIFEISYVFSTSLRSKQLEVDAAVIKLLDNWIK